MDQTKTIKVERKRISMKVHYNRKTDYLEIFFKQDSSYYESSQDSRGPYIVFIGENSGDIIGYGIEDASNNTHLLDKLSSEQKLSLFSWVVTQGNMINLKNSPFSHTN